MEEVVRYTVASTENEIRQIHALMGENLVSTVSPEIAKQQGFVTFSYTLDSLLKMNTEAPHIVALVGDRVVGYALTALRTVSLPMFAPLVEAVETLSYQGKSLSEASYYLMGQICVSEDFRGKGIFDGLYQQHRNEYSSTFNYLITDISIRNTRSLAAHRRVGFEVIHTFTDDTSTHDTWDIVLWNWNERV